MISFNKVFFIKAGIIIMPAVLFFTVEPLQIAVSRVVFILSMVDITAMKSYILSFGVWAPVASFMLMVFQSLIAPLPAFVITFANAALFGWAKGALLSWSSAMCGAVLCYWLARFYGRATVERLTSRFALDQVDFFFEQYGRHAILVARLLPFVSFDVVSYAAGLTSIGFRGFFWATALGQLPATIVYSYVGDLLVGSVKTFVYGILMLTSLGIIAFAVKKAHRDRKILAGKKHEPLRPFR